jgi:hypothetical protein
LNEVEYIRLAGEMGMGCTDLEQIKIAGEKLEDVRKPFKRLTLDYKKLREMDIYVVACDACSGCSHAVSSYINGLEVNGNLDKLKGSTLIYGQNPYIPEDSTGKIIRLGVCARNLEGASGIYVPGCPPHPIHIDDFLAGKGFENE